MVGGICEAGKTPHVAAKASGNAIDGRTTRHAGYAVSQRLRKRVEEIFGWMKTVGLMRGITRSKHMRIRKFFRE